MLVRETKLLNGSKEQYQALDQAIRTAQFIRNTLIRSQSPVASRSG